MLRYIGNVEGRFSDSEPTQKGAWSRERWWSCPLGGRARRKSLCDAACAPFFGETQGRRINSAEPRGAVEDGLKDGLKVVRRAGDRAKHLRHGRLLRSEFSYLLSQL
jgi:hypothetical protein